MRLAILLGVLTIFGCNVNNKSKGKGDVEVINRTYQNWANGIGTAKGYNIELDLVLHDPDVTIDSIFVDGLSEKLVETVKDEHDHDRVDGAHSYKARYTIAVQRRKVKGVENKEEERLPKITEAKVYFTYTDNKGTKKIEIKDLKKKESLFYP